MEGFAKIAYPLHKLSDKGQKFHFSQECEEAFIELKQRLITAPILAYPRVDLSFIPIQMQVILQLELFSPKKRLMGSIQWLMPAES